MIAAFRTHVFEVAEDVGKRFAEEARRIHYRLGPERPIHGQASFEDAHALIEEGVAILPVPPLPDEKFTRRRQAKRFPSSPRDKLALRIEVRT